MLSPEFPVPGIPAGIPVHAASPRHLPVGAVLLYLHSFSRVRRHKGLTMRLAAFRPLGLSGLSLFLSVAAFGSGAPAQGVESESCSIHIWQRGIYGTQSASNFGAFGALGMVLQDEYDRKYPAASVEGVMEDVLRIQALPTTMSSIPWRNYTRVDQNTVVFEHETISDQSFKDLKKSTARNSTSQANCYIEIYIGSQTFSGSGIRSVLYSDFYARTFYDGAQRNKGAILWNQTPRLSFKDADGIATARKNIADSFFATFSEFLTKKLPKRNVRS